MSVLSLQSRRVVRPDAAGCYVNLRGDVAEPMLTEQTEYVIDGVFARQDRVKQHSMLRLVKNEWTTSPWKGVRAAHTAYHFAYEYLVYTDWRQVVDKTLTLRSDSVCAYTDDELRELLNHRALRTLLRTITNDPTFEADLRALKRDAEGRVFVELAGINATGEFYLTVRHYLPVINLLRHAEAGSSEQMFQLDGLLHDLNDTDVFEVLMLALSAELGDRYPNLPHAEKVALIG